jgi:hypothetical protein
MGKMKPIYALIFAVATVCGCGPKQNPGTAIASTAAVPPAIRASSAAIVPDGRTSISITGAFGWTLGQKIENPGRFDAGTFYNDDGNTNTPGFDHVEVKGLVDGTVYEIDAGIDPLQSDVVKAALESKYGPGGFEPGAETWIKGSRKLKFGGTWIAYIDAELQRESFRENDDFAHRAGTNLAQKL